MSCSRLDRHLGTVCMWPLSLLRRFRDRVFPGVPLAEMIPEAAHRLKRRMSSDRASGSEKMAMVRHEQLVRTLFRTLLAREASDWEATSFARRVESGRLDALGLVQRLLAAPECWHGRVPLYVPPGHYYSPIADPRQLDRAAFTRRAPERLLDVAIDLNAMTDLWHELLPIMRATPFPVEKAEPFRYYFSNPSFAFGDAIILRAMILHRKPSRMVEVGSGYSSACTLDTVQEGGLDVKLTFVEPHPDLLMSLIRPEDRGRVRLIETGVQKAPLSVFTELEAGDILFIDSTHIVKPGSDVTYELAEILPRVKPGVLIHFHDMFYPFEYSVDWAVDENRSWNELYAIRAFLAYNEHFRVVFFNHMLKMLRGELAQKTCPNFMLNCGGGLWLERTR
jgi:predicted O-methyltransferase YrrM